MISMYNSHKFDDSILEKEKTAVVLYSGGKGSFLAAYLAKQLYAKVVLYFNDTKTEDLDLYRFLKETVAWLDLPFVEDSDGRDVWQVFEDRKYLGNSRVDTCSEILKRKRSHKWIEKNYPDASKVDVIIGLGAFEEHRIEKAAPHWKPYKLVCPLADGFVDETALLQELSATSGIKEPRLYAMGFPHNNCGGFCVKAGLAQFKLLYEKLPEVYAYHEQKQEELIQKVPTVRPFLKKQVKGEQMYLTLKQYREGFLEAENIDKDPDMTYNFGNCSCAI
jgi:hypothetical protein